MKNKRKTKGIPIWAQMGHRAPTTRREFLSYGVIPFAAHALIPGGLGSLLLPNRAVADTISNCSYKSLRNVPYIALNLSGGAAMMANYVPRDQGGQVLADMSMMGLGQNSGGGGANLPLATQFGVQSFAGAPAGTNQHISRMLVGIEGTASAATLANTAFIAFCNQTRDDSADNQMDISGMVSAAGLQGQLLPNMGTDNSMTGGRHRPATVLPPSPLVVRNFNDVSASIGVTRALASNLSKTQQEKLAKVVSSLNGEQAKKFLSMNATKEVLELVECAGIKNQTLVNQGSATVDPRTNAQLSTLWTINNNTAANNQNLVFATMVYNALMELGGAANLTLGGYDYHDGTRTTGDQRDQQAGQVIGRILESAALLGKKVFLYVSTDGSVVSTQSATPNSPWRSDRGIVGVSFAFMYDPTGRPETTGHQVGHFKVGQAVDTSTITGGNTELNAQAVFANYLKFAGKIELFDKIVPRSTVSSVLSKVVKVA